MDWPFEGLANEVSVCCCLNKSQKHRFYTYAGEIPETNGIVIAERVKMSFVDETGSKHCNTY